MVNKHCSTYMMCMAAITAMCSVALMGIAFNTDNWRHITVDRNSVRVGIKENNEKIFNEEIDIETDHKYFDRVQGLFRVCFPHEEKPKTNELYLNPVEEWCSNIDYFFQIWDNGIWPKRLTHHGEIWFHVARVTVAVFCLYFMFMAIGCVTGFLGCWKASGDHLISTASLFLLASLSGASGMALWHWAQFLEMEKVFDERLDFFQTWPEFLQTATTFTLGWSYITAWFSIGLALLASITFSCSAITIKSEFRNLDKRQMRAMMRYGGPNYAPYSSHVNTVMRQPNACMPECETPPLNHTRRNSLSFPNYYSAGYPVQFEDDDTNLENGFTRTIKYKNVVKELDAKI